MRTELEGAETVWREDLNGIGGGINVALEDALFLFWRGLYVIFLALEEPIPTYWNRHGIVELFLCWSRHSSRFG